MANFHLTAKIIKRGTGASAVAAAAYRHAEKLTDERQGLLHDYSRKRGVLYSEIVMPASAKGWTPTRAELWNAVEVKNKRADAQLARELEIALPHELTADQRRDTALAMARYIAERYSVAVDVALHAPSAHGDERNYHAHLMLTTNRVDGAGFANKARELDFIAAKKGGGPEAPNEIDRLREQWAMIANAALEQAGFDIRIDHRSNEARGIDAEPTGHVGVAASSIDRKFADGIVDAPSERGALNEEIRARNAERAMLKVEHAQATAEIFDIDAEREKREADAKARDQVAITEALTERRATFTRRELSRHLGELVPGMQERIALTDAILAGPEIIPLRENADAVVSRYTTRDVLAREQQILTAARRMDDTKTHGITARQLADILDVHSSLDQEQRAAVAHATAPGRVALIAGEAGTGKSTTFAGVRDAYEDAGYRVIGLSWTNAVVQDMKAGGFKNTSTVAAELMRLEQPGRGRKKWNANTVIMVDEAAMLSTKHLASLMQKADESGAKIILGGDDKQLASIERGGMFGALKTAHGAAELHKVYRVADADQKRAFNAMHGGDFRAALGIFDQQGAIQWSRTPEDSRAALVAKWASDTAAEPGKSRFIFAYTNSEVDELNRDARAILKERGELGDDHKLKTKHGELDFATGDRVQFTGSGATKKLRDAGLFNGAMGTLEAIDGNRVTVKLDGPDNKKPRSVSFTVGDEKEDFAALRPGYAGTIYKGQGKSLSQTYVLHSDNWRSATSYVALSRHKENVSLFAAEQAGAWMMAEGGLEGLTERQRASAEKSYATWSAAKPKLAARHDFADYVGYVQAQWQDEKELHRLDRMARQMGRVEEIRAASQFVEGVKPQVSLVSQIVGDYVALCQNPAKDWKAWAAVSLDQPAVTRQAARAEVTGPQPSIVAQIVGDYVALCQDPAKDWKAWAAVSLDQQYADPQTPSLAKEGEQEHGNTYTKGPNAIMEEPDRLRGDALHGLQSGLGEGEPREGRRREQDISGLPARPGAGVRQDDKLQPLRAERGRDGGDGGGGLKPPVPLTYAEQIDARAAELGAARSAAQPDPNELAAVKQLLDEIDAQAAAAAAGSKEQNRFLTQSRNIARELLHMQGQLPGEDSEAEQEAKADDWRQAYDAVLAETLERAEDYDDKMQIRAEFFDIKQEHDKAHDDDKGRYRSREPDRGQTR